MGAVTSLDVAGKPRQQADLLTSSEPLPPPLPLGLKCWEAEPLLQPTVGRGAEPLGSWPPWEHPSMQGPPHGATQGLFLAGQ